MVYSLFSYIWIEFKKEIMIKASLNVLKTAFDYEERTTRKELGLFFLICLVFPFLLSGLLLYLSNLIGIEKVKIEFYVMIPMFLGILIGMIALPFIIIKRLHDVGKNGWNILLPLIPLIGVIWFIYLILSNSEKKDNEYGKYKQIEMNV